MHHPFRLHRRRQNCEYRTSAGNEPNRKSDNQERLPAGESAYAFAKTREAPEKFALGGRSLNIFKDQRASDIGDIITVLIDISDEAALENETERTRASDEDSTLTRLLGYEQSLDRILPEDINATTGLLNPSLTDFGSNSTHSGEGSVEREEEIEVRMAALITQILPNGNLVIHGRQEVVVNFEKRILQIDGVIRPEDITIQNDISYDKIAEARILYGGEGQLTDMQQPRYGQQLYDIIFPF